MKKIVLISLLCLFAIPRSIAMEKEQESVELVPISEYSDPGAKVAWYNRLYNCVCKNKAKTALGSALVLFTAGGLASDYSTMVIAGSPTYTATFIALPTDGTLPPDTEDCTYRIEASCYVDRTPVENFDQCETYFDESRMFYLQSRLNKDNQTLLTGFVSFFSRLGMIVPPIMYAWAPGKK